jgi:EpsI family protein
MSRDMRSTRRAAVLGLCMLGAAALAQRLTPKDRSKEPLNLSLETMIPTDFGEWRPDSSLRPVAMSTDADNTLYAVYDALLGRTYINAQGQRVMLSLGYSRQQGGVQKPHWQEICYRSQGYTVTDITRAAQVVAGKPIPITRMLAKNGSRVEPVTYWLTLGDTVVKDRWDRLGQLLTKSLTGDSAEGFLVRISSLAAEPQAAYALHLNFAQAMLAAMPAEQRQRLVGAG